MSGYVEWLLAKLPDNIQLVRSNNGWTASTIDGQAKHGQGTSLDDALYQLALKLCVVS